MSKSQSDLILHPIRMRIIQSLIGGVSRTRQQISETLTDVPQATMYRHLNLLHKSKLIEVVEQKQVRGTIEKVYALAEHGSDISINDLNVMNSEEHLGVFAKFIGTLIGEFGRYLGQDGYDLIRDGVSFRQIVLNLSDEEYLQLLQGMRTLMAQHLGNDLNEERRRRTIATIVIPETKHTKHSTGDKDGMDDQ